MYHHPGDSLIANAERRFGGFAIPHLIRWVAVLQLTVWGLELFSRTGGSEGGSTLVNYLYLTRDDVLSGQVWRLVTFVLIPGTLSPLFILFQTFFLWFVSDGVEQAWGAFRTNLYVYATVGCLMILGMMPGIGDWANFQTAFLFFTAMFLAFAAHYPNQVINLFGIIPIKAKWLGWADAAIMLSYILRESFSIFPIMAAMLPYLVVFLPGFLHEWRSRGETATRRASFEAEMKAGTGEAFHTCEACGKTDVTDPELEFRVSAAGEEYCIDCLTLAKKERPAEG